MSTDPKAYAPIPKHLQPHYAEVTAIDLVERLAILSDGTTAPITELVNHNGLVTEDPADALTFAVELPSAYIVGKVKDYEQVTTQ